MHDPEVATMQLLTWLFTSYFTIGSPRNTIGSAKGGTSVRISCAPTALPSTTSGWRPTMNRSFARTIGPRTGTSWLMTRAQDAALQIGSICPTLSQYAFRPVQQLQRSASSRLPVDAADLQSGSHGAVAERYCRGMSRLCSSFRLS